MANRYTALLIFLITLSACSRNRVVQQPVELPDISDPLPLALACEISFSTNPIEATLVGSSGNSIISESITISVSGNRGGVSENTYLVGLGLDGGTLEDSNPGGIQRDTHVVNASFSKAGDLLIRARVAVSSGERANCQKTLSINGSAQVTPDVSMVTQNLVSLEEVPYGGSLFITWNASHVDSCTITKNGVPVLNALGQAEWGTSGIIHSGELTELSVIFSILCDGDYGQASDLVVISVIPLPTATLLIDGSDTPNELPPGGRIVEASWYSSDAIGCELRADGTLISSDLGLGTIAFPVTEKTVFKLKCFDAGFPANTVTKTVTVDVAIPLNPRVTLTKYVRSVPKGQPARLTWSSSDVTRCELRQKHAGASNHSIISRAKHASNFITANVNRPQTFTLHCSGPGGSKQTSVTIGVSETNKNVPETAMPKDLGSQRWPGNRDGNAAVKVIDNLVPGLKLSYAGMSGNSILRVYHGRVYHVYACPQKIGGQFLDASGNVIAVPGYAYGFIPMSALESGFVIPAGAESFYGSTSDSAYFDNCGRRGASQCTGGCHFTIEQYK